MAAEVPVYRALGPRPFLAALLGAGHEPVPFIVLERVEGRRPAMGADLQGRVDSLLDEVAACPPPSELRRLVDPSAGGSNPWDAVVDAPARLARMDVDHVWMSASLPALRDVAAAARLAGTLLVHLDVNLTNLIERADGSLVLIDWASAAVGNGALDGLLWRLSAAAAGGPQPSGGPATAAAEIAHIAGTQVLMTPSRDSNPALHAWRQHLFLAALAWSAELLGIDTPPTGLRGA